MWAPSNTRKETILTSSLIVARDPIKALSEGQRCCILFRHRVWRRCPRIYRVRRISDCKVPWWARIVNAFLRPLENYFQTDSIFLRCNRACLWNKAIIIRRRVMTGTLTLLRRSLKMWPLTKGSTSKSWRTSRSTCRLLPSVPATTSHSKAAKEKSRAKTTLPRTESGKILQVHKGESRDRPLRKSWSLLLHRIWNQLLLIIICRLRKGLRCRYSLLGSPAS